MSDIPANSPTAVNNLAQQEILSYTNFSLQLLQFSSQTEQNTPLSPFPIISSLTMCASGAKEQTLIQIENALGIPIDTLNTMLYSYTQQLSQHSHSELNLANAIWFKNDSNLAIHQKFLKKNADYYQAGIYQSAFDEHTCKDINEWVKEKTNGQINHFTDHISNKDIMYLIHALSFEASWHQDYQDDEIKSGSLTGEDRQIQNASFMYSTENQYLKDEYACGFIKYYQNGQYAVDDHLADFSTFGNYQSVQIAIHRILHLAKISFDENGTKTGTASATQMIAVTSLFSPDEMKTGIFESSVYLSHYCRTKPTSAMDRNCNAFRLIHLFFK